MAWPLVFDIGSRRSSPRLRIWFGRDCFIVIRFQRGFEREGEIAYLNKHERDRRARKT